MIAVETLVVQEPVAPGVEVVSIAEPLDRERQPPRQTDVVVVPRGDELAACQTNGGVLFVAYKGCDSQLKEVLVVRGTVIGGADAADRWQARFLSGACACGPPKDASIQAVAGLQSL